MSESKLGNLIDYSVIEKAVTGDIDAIEIIIQHYSRYTAALCRRFGYDETGNLITYVDADLVNRLEMKLIVSILRFNLA